MVIPELVSAMSMVVTESSVLRMARVRQAPPLVMRLWAWAMGAFQAMSTVPASNAAHNAS